MTTVVLLVTGLALPSVAQTVVATRTIMARSILVPTDLEVLDRQADGAVTQVESLIGKEALVNLYAGRAIVLADVGTPAILERNQLVEMVFASGLLTISAGGRVLDRAGIGERVRVMNLESRLTVTGRVLANGTVEVGQ